MNETTKWLRAFEGVAGTLGTVLGPTLPGWGVAVVDAVAAALGLAADLTAGGHDAAEALTAMRPAGPDLQAMHARLEEYARSKATTQPLPTAPETLVPR